jgi:putative transposase
MDNNPKSNHRRSIRLREYNYSQPGAYFITIVSCQRKNIFGNIVDGEMILNQVGKIVEKIWLEISKHFPNTRCDIFVIMPNHIHGIIEIIEIVNDGPVGATHESPLPERRSGPKPKSIGVMVGLFKAAVTK